MTARLCFASLVTTVALLVSCKDFFGEPPDPGAAGPVEGGVGGTGGLGGAGGVGGDGINGGGGNAGAGGETSDAEANVTTLDANVNVSSIALDAENVYVASDVGLLRVSKAGGAVAPLAVLSNSGTTGIAVDATYVYWVDNSGAVNAVPKAGGMTKVVAPSGPGGGGGSIAIDAASVFYTTGPYLRQAPVGGGAFTELSTSVGGQGPNGSNRLAIDATNVYFVSILNGQQSATLSTVPKAGGTVASIETPKGEIRAVAVAPPWVYYLDVYALGTWMGDLKRVKHDGTASSVVATITSTNGPLNGGALAVDDDFAYVGTSSGLARVSVASPSPVDTIDANVWVVALATDTTSIYYAQQGGPGGNRLAKMPK